MTLTEKVINLKLQAAFAARHANFWQKAILEHGEEKATEFYKHLGLNHLSVSRETKSYEWEGLTLAREPRESEKIAVKGIATAQETAKESISKILLDLREELISDGLKGIRKLKPSTYHELTLQASAGIRESLRDRLIKVHKQGRILVAAELGKKESVPDDEFDDLDLLTDLTGGRVANDVQSRIIAATQRYSLLGTTGDSLITVVQTEIQAGSVSYIDRASQGLANRVISIGRSDEAERRSDEWDRVEYSALLDQNVCEPCAAEDGKTGNSEDDLQPTPNPECLGGDYCRCFHVYINQ